MADTEAIKTGKVQIAALLREVAKEREVNLTSVRWWNGSGDPPRSYTLEAGAGMGVTDDISFKPEHLIGCETDNQMIVQVRMKVESLVNKLKKYGR